MPAVFICQSAPSSDNPCIAISIPECLSCFLNAAAPCPVPANHGHDGFIHLSSRGHDGFIHLLSLHWAQDLAFRSNQGLVPETLCLAKLQASLDWVLVPNFISWPVYCCTLRLHIKEVFFLQRFFKSRLKECPVEEHLEKVLCLWTLIVTIYYACIIIKSLDAP